MGLLSSLRDWMDRRSAMREIRGLKRDAAPYDELEKGRLLFIMNEAAIREDPELALLTWQRLYILAPDSALTSDVAINALIGIKLFDKAEEVVSQALRRFPGVLSLLEHHAMISERRGDMDEAVRRWEIVRQRYPDRLSGYTRGGSCLKWTGRIDEADALLATAVTMGPDELAPALEYASVAEYAKQWEEALRRWTVVRERFHAPIGWVQSAACLRELGRDPEGEQLLFKARYTFQGEAAILVELGWIAQRRQDWPEALRRWQSLQETFPNVATGYIGAAFAYREIDEHSKADEILERGLRRNEEDVSMPIEYARLAERRGDWEEAIRRWTLLRERFPHVPEGYHGAAYALTAAGQPEEAERILAMRS